MALGGSEVKHLTAGNSEGGFVWCEDVQREVVEQSKKAGAGNEGRTKPSGRLRRNSPARGGRSSEAPSTEGPEAYTSGFGTKSTRTADDSSKIHT